MSYIKACDYKGCQNNEYSRHCKIRDIEEETALYLADNCEWFDKGAKHICDVCVELVNEDKADDDYPLLICDHMGRVMKNPTFITKIPTLRREDV